MRTGILLTLCQLYVNVQSSTIIPRATSQTQDHIILLVHASTAVLAWAFFFPLGSILLRLIESKNAFWVHVGIQSFATSIYTVAVGTGIHLAEKYEELNHYHPILGLTIFALLSVQIIGGILHHLFFRKYLRRTVISYIHIWLGRILVTVGIINGGLGLLMAYRRPTVAQYVAYGVLAGFMWVIFVGIGFWKGPVGVRLGGTRMEKGNGDGNGEGDLDEDRWQLMERKARRGGDLGPPRRRERARVAQRDRIKEPEEAFRGT